MPVYALKQYPPFYVQDAAWKQYNEIMCVSHRYGATLDERREDGIQKCFLLK